MKRKIQLLLVISFFAAMFSGCKEEWDPLQRPVIPEDKEYDVNDDQIIDFKLIYRIFTWDGAYTSGDLIAGEIVPVNNNRFLLNRDLELLFGQMNDTIFNQIESPYLWVTAPKDIPFLLSIKSVNTTGWEREWTTLNNVKKDFYYLSFKIPIGDKEYLGWIKLKINDLTGQVEITDKKFISQDFIIIDR